MAYASHYSAGLVKGEKRVRRFLQQLLAVLYPQRNLCHACGAPLTQAEALLCGSCEKDLQTCAYSPARAATVLDAGVEAFSAFAYRAQAAALVKALKFGADYTAALPLAEGMTAVYTRFPTLREADVCVPVPVHYRRLRRRGYNQAAVLARVFSQQTGMPVMEDALVRVHHKHSQVGQGRMARLHNIQGAFRVSVRGESRLAGARVLLVDDVLTTGATSDACARALMDAGAQTVAVLTACRV